MGLFDIQDTHVALEELLNQERAAILNGQYDKLERFIDEKERLLNALAKTRVDPKILSRLREQTERNGILYDAMRSGIGSALDRLKSMKEPGPALKTYDKTGRQTEIPATDTAKVRRA